MIHRIHMVEPGGRGGVFQHALALSSELSGAGFDVVLHTATDLERKIEGVKLCLCVRWHRKSRHRRLRRLYTAADFAATTLPHLFNAVRSGDVVHVQGLFALTPELITVARMRRATVVSSPHNTFVRSGSAGGGRSLAHALKRTDRILVYSDADRRKLTNSSPKVGQVPLVQWTPPVRPDLVKQWRATLSAERSPLAVLAGQVREDKNPELLVEAVAHLDGWRGAVVGEDLGAGARVNQRIRATGAPVKTVYRYLDIDEFVALVAAADVIVTPYSVASQSGVLAVAAKLGVPTATVATGGLGELATAVARDSSPQAIRDAILSAYERGAVKPGGSDVAAAYIAEYDFAQQQHLQAMSVQHSL